MENAPIPAPRIKKNARILLISNMNTGPSKHNIQSKKEMIYDTLKNSNLISEIIVTSIDSIKHFTEFSLSSYHCVIYDLLDHGCEIENPQKEIEKYIKNGGNIIVTHDHANRLLDILGLKRVGDDKNKNKNKKKKTNINKISHYNKVINVNFDHDIWKSYYNLENIKIMNIMETHGKLYASNKETKQVMHSYDNNNDLYLSTRNIGMGKAIFWNAGHTPNINEEEKKLFLNMIAWVLKENN